MREIDYHDGFLTNGKTKNPNKGLFGGKSSFS